MCESTSEYVNVVMKSLSTNAVILLNVIKPYHIYKASRNKLTKPHNLMYVQLCF